MHAATDRLEFAPPATPGLMRAMLLALLAHGLLLAALTSGIRWNHEAPIASVAAELWSAVPTEAAPPLPEPVQAPPTPAPPPEPVITKPAPEPEPATPPKLPDADITLQQEKLRQKKLHEQEQRAQKLQEQKKLEKLKLDRLELERIKQEKLKLAQAEKLAADKKKTELDAKQLEAQRAKNLERISGLAGATGSPTSAGTDLKSAGPSAGYAGRISARVKPNIVFTDDIAGNPSAEVEVLTSPSGTIIGRRIIKSSGVRSWDEAVLKALDKTEVLPLDNGKVYNPMTLVFRPKD